MERVSSLSKINILGYSLIIILNAIDLIINKTYIRLPLNIIPFSGFVLLLLIVRKEYKVINAVIYYMLGYLLSIAGDEGNFSGSIFVVAALYLDPGRNRTILRLSLIVVAIAIKSLFINPNHLQLIKMLFAHTAVYITYFVLHQVSKPINQFDIEDQTLQIIRLLANGKELKEIAHITCLSYAAVQKRIKRLVEKHGRKNAYDLVRYLIENGQRL